MSLIDIIESQENQEAWASWRPEAPPANLNGVKEIELDVETTGLKWWEDDEPIGVSYYFDDGRYGYLPTGHVGGNNLPKEHVVNFLKSLRNVTITNLNTRFDNHMLYSKWNVDFEEQGCILSDVAHDAALLDDFRREFSLASLCRDYLSDEKKVTEIAGRQIDARRMREYPAGMIAIRAIADVRQVNKLKHYFRPKLVAEDLMRVKNLENQVIYAVCEMERNGMPLDLELLDRLVKLAEQQFKQCLWDIYRETGINFNPDANASWLALFQHLKLPIENFTAKGKASFTGAVLKRVNHPLVKTGLHAAKLADLQSKYLLKYQRTVGRDGILRYALHQLKYQKDEKDDNAQEAGTGSGRFSSSAISVNGEDIGANIQQVLAVEKNIESYGEDFIIRALMVGGKIGDDSERRYRVISADAEQIEYRIFADYARSPKILAAYAENPRLKFHNLIWDMLKPHKPDLGYKPLKNLNFAKIYGAKILKIAFMMEYITAEDMKELGKLSATNYRAMLRDPRLTQAHEVMKVYNRELPEVEPLLERASELANQRGFVKTMLGRRIRFPMLTFRDKEGRPYQKRDRLHKALNGVIQGSAADIMKTKLVEVRQARKTLPFLLRATVHDELVGDELADNAVPLLSELLDRQSFPEMKVPILWSVKVGENWAAPDIEKVMRERSAA